MFSGLVQGVGSIESIAPFKAGSDDLRMWIAMGTMPHAPLEMGESICVRGCCLTVVDARESANNQAAAFDISPETLRVTAGFAVGQRVNLEKSLTLQDKLGGHLVTGHVDGIGTVAEFIDVGGSWHLVIDAPAPLAKYIARKGSITVDGVSLTVNTVTGARFELNIIPHTLAVTTLSGLKAGDAVNLEVDLIARYVERMLGFAARATDV
jgi:riboflavin synthase